LGERAAWRQLQGIVAGTRRFERIPAPGDRAHALLAKPQQHFASFAGNARRDDAARRTNERSEARLVGGERRRREEVAPVLLLDPLGELADLLGSGRFANRLDATFVKQRGAGRAERLQQQALAVEQGALPVAFARDVLDHALLEPPHRKFALHANETLQCRDAGADNLREKFADSAHFEVHHPRRVMVAGNEAPESAANHQRDDERRRNPHILQILLVNWRNAAQEAQRHVELLAGKGRESGFERRRCKIDVGEQTYAVALIESACDLRDIGGWISIAEKGFELCALAFGIDLSVPR